MSSYQKNLTLIALLSFCISSAADVEIFVAPNGSNTNPGSRTQPFATLERARDELRARQTVKREPSTVWLGGGDYLRTNCLELTAADSGTHDAAVTWRAMRGERPRFLGGVIVTNFQRVMDSDALKRLEPEAREHVWEASLRQTGISEFAELKSRGFGRPTTPSHNELFYAGRPMPLARWPNQPDWEHITGFPTSNAQADGHGGQIGKLEEGFFFSGNRPSRWKDPLRAWVHGYWSWDWANSYEHVAEIDGNRLKTSAPFGLYGFRKGQRFYFLNILEELDSPGEWYLETAKGALYFWPPEGENLAPRQGCAPEVTVSRLGDPFVRLTDVSHVSMEGIIFEASRGTAVVIRGGSSNELTGCVIRDVGNYGVQIEGGQGNGVKACDILDTGDGGVTLSGGDRQTLIPGGNYVENCRFERQGRWSKCYVPAILISGVGQRASHNLIQEHPHCAILFSGNDHLIELNEIHHIALETGDVGAIYTGRDYTYRGNRIRYNFIHETGGVGMGSMGIYMDDCVSGTEIYGNVFYKVQRAVFLGGGRDHVVRNNIFVECNHAIELDGRGLDTSAVWHDMVDNTMRSQLGKVPLVLYRERYPKMKTLDACYGPPGGPATAGAVFKGVPPANNEVDLNVCVGKWLNVYWHATNTPDMVTVGRNLTNAAPFFAQTPGQQPRATDFELKRNMPLWQDGFIKLPLQSIGLVNDKRRQNLPKL